MAVFPRTTSLTALPSWPALANKAQQLKGFRLTEAFKADPGRFARMQCQGAGILLDTSRNLVDDEALTLLTALAREAGMEEARHQLLTGGLLNSTENRPALHTALRRGPHAEPLCVNGQDTVAEIEGTLARIERLVRRVQSGEWRGYSGERITDVVNIGIGGSFLGPRLVSDALSYMAHPDIKLHFVANIDPNDIYATLTAVQPGSVLFILASKSFNTMETLENALTARAWLMAKGVREEDLHRHFVAVSSRPDRAKNFGIDPDNVFPMWDWVGGRYSLWSAIGLPVMMSIGITAFRSLLAGARAMDEHFRDAPLEANLPVVMGLLGLWHMQFHDAHSHAVLPYDAALRHLPAYLQQLDMESNGKSVTHDGQPLTHHSGPVIWGDLGTNGQHAYHQLPH